MYMYLIHKILDFGRLRNFLYIPVSMQIEFFEIFRTSEHMLSYFFNFVVSKFHHLYGWWQPKVDCFNIICSKVQKLDENIKIKTNIMKKISNKKNFFLNWKHVYVNHNCMWQYLVIYRKNCKFKNFCGCFAVLFALTLVKTHAVKANYRVNLKWRQRNSCNGSSKLSYKNLYCEIWLISYDFFRIGNVFDLF